MTCGLRLAQSVHPGRFRVVIRSPFPDIVIEPFPTFSEIHTAALKALRHEIALARNAVGAEA
jgi:hypothetical protein